jgi:hypothetical protein
MKLLVLLVASLLLGLLSCYVILDVSKMYNLSFIYELGYLKLYGLITIIQ